MKEFHSKIVSLNGEWEMTYTREAPGDIPPPKRSAFTGSLPVPAIWDDYPDRFVNYDPLTNPDHAEVDFSAWEENPPDSSTPFIVGTVWLRREVILEGRYGFIGVGGARLEAWCWIDGRCIGHHLGHATGFEFSLPEEDVRSGGEHEIVLAISNVRQDRLGCDLRGFAGRSGGVMRGVELQLVPLAGVADFHVSCDEELGHLTFEAELSGDLSEVTLSWEVRMKERGRRRRALAGGEIECGPSMSWRVSSADFPKWSDGAPTLLEAHLILRTADGGIADCQKRPFGIRRLLAQGKRLFLNGSPIFLRGATEHCYFPDTTVPHADLAKYREMISRFQSLGFNWLRFHTWVPPEEYLTAADEAGMLIQVEPPVGAGRYEWEAILRAVRRHPSVVIICAGNEECLTEEKITLLESLAKLTKELAPDLLFNPQEALRGVEYGWKPSDLGSPVERLPFRHNPSRLRWLHRFSDLFGQYPLGQLSYVSTNGNWRAVERNLGVFDKPCLSHELCIHGSFLDFTLMERHRGTREGTRIYDSAWREVERAGFQSRVTEIHRASCSWMQTLRKHCVEMARRCPSLAGYDLLGAVDYHWHRHGYPCGIMNEYFELKPGETAQDVVRYNGSSVLLLDLGQKRNYLSGSIFKVDLAISLFEKEAPGCSAPQWRLVNRRGAAVAAGQLQMRQLRNGCVNELGELIIELPEVSEPGAYSLQVSLDFGERQIANHWNIWIFPPSVVPNAHRVRIVDEVSEGLFEQLARGETVLLHLRADESLPLRDLSFQISIAGRANGSLALLPHPHPVWGDFPRDHFCDWQFYSLIEGAVALSFGKMKGEFDPILEVVPSFKRMEHQSALFECRVGKGRIMVCGLCFPEGEPGAEWLYGQIITYLHSYPPEHVHEVTAQELKAAFKGRSADADHSLTTDMGFDALGQLKRS